MKIMIWILTLVGLTPVLVIGTASFAMAILNRISLSNQPGLVTHFTASNLFFELGVIKLVIRPAILPGVLAWVGALLVVYALRSVMLVQR